MKQIVSRVFVASVFVVAAASARAQSVYQLTDLGMLPGCTSSSAMGMTDQGEVVGSCGNTNAFNAQSGWAAANGALAPIGKLPGGTYSIAAAANAVGWIVGNGDTGNSRPQAILARGGQVINIDPVSGGNALAIGVTDTGAIFGDLTSSLSGNTSSWRVVLWTEDPSHPGRFRRTQLPLPTGGTSKSTGVFALGSSNAGFVAGWATNNLIGQQGALWANDSAHTLIVLPGLGGQSIAEGVNNVGQVVGYSQGTNGGHAVLWGNDAAHTVTDLGVLPGDTSSQAVAVNDVGQAVGISSNAVGESHPFLYTQGQMFALASLLDASGAAWTIDQVVAINLSGQIAGSGIVNGERHAFLLTPAP